MPPVTLAQLRQRVRARADMESSDFVPDTELDVYLNESIRGLYDLLVAKHEDYYLATATLALAGDSVALPTNFYKLLALEVESGGRWHRLRPYTWAQMTELRNVTGSRPETTRFRLAANTLSLLPALAEPVSGRLTYIPQCPALVAPTDTVDFLQGWELWAVLDSAIKCAGKEETDTTHLEKELARVQARIEALAEDRTPGEVERAQDTYSGMEDSGEPSTRGWR